MHCASGWSEGVFGKRSEVLGALQGSNCILCFGQTSLMAPSLRPLEHKADGSVWDEIRGVLTSCLAQGGIPLLPRHPAPFHPAHLLVAALGGFPSCQWHPAQTSPSQAAKDAGRSLSYQFGIRALVEGRSSQINPFACPI